MAATHDVEVTLEVRGTATVTLRGLTDPSPERLDEYLRRSTPQQVLDQFIEDGFQARDIEVGDVRPLEPALAY